MAEGERRRRGVLLRRAVWIAATLVVFVVGWFIVIRATSPWRAVTVHEIEPVVVPPGERIPGRVRVGVYNIAHGRGLAESNWDGGDAAMRRERLDAIADQILGRELDIVVLNEVDFRCTWSGGVNQAAYLAERAGFAYRVEQTNLDASLPFVWWRFGNAVLSRHPIIGAELIDLPVYSWWEASLVGKKRGVSCRIALPDGDEIEVLGVHLEDRSEGARLRSVEHLIGIVDGAEGSLVLAGDLNTTPSAFPRARRLSDGRTAFDHLIERTDLRYSDAASDHPSYFTYRADRPDRVIDWVLARGERFIRGHGVHLSTLSDHRMVFSDLWLVR